MNNSVDNSPANEWELSKENVQPLKSGRKVASLTAALQPLSTDQSKIREQKQIFEAEVRTYTGSDPLDVWHRYIEWTEQNFPKGGKISQLSVILERCVSLFKEDDRYKNDPRYLDAWIKFSKICNDPLEIYNFIYNLGIGAKLAAFYKAWAWELEQAGNTKKADTIYIQGIQNGAEPLDHLGHQHREFQARVAQKLVSGMAESMDDEPGSPSRSALGELRTSGSKHKVPVNRVDAVRPVARGGLKTALAPIKGNTGPGFQVFNDENAGASFALPTPSGEWKQMGARSQVNRENEQKPGIWTNTKVKQRNTGVVPVSAASSHNAPKFEVHADDNVDQPLTTPRKVTQVDQILSAKKDKYVDPFQNIQQQPQNKKEIVMYCKDLIYGGAEEFSFEELRAASHMAKKKKVPTATLR